MSYLEKAKAWEVKNAMGKKEEPSPVFDFAAEAKKVRAALDEKGIVKLHSNALGEELYWARGDQEAAKAPAGAVVYTLAELKEVLGLKAEPGAIKQIHEAKRIFSGSKLKGGETEMRNIEADIPKVFKSSGRLIEVNCNKCKKFLAEVRPGGTVFCPECQIWTKADS